MLVNTKVPDFVLNVLARDCVFKTDLNDLAGVEETLHVLR